MAGFSMNPLYRLVPLANRRDELGLGLRQHGDSMRRHVARVVLVGAAPVDGSMAT